MVLCYVLFHRDCLRHNAIHPPWSLCFLYPGRNWPRAGIWPVSGSQWSCGSRASYSKYLSSSRSLWTHGGYVDPFTRVQVGCHIPRLILGCVGHPICLCGHRTHYLGWSWMGTRVGVPPWKSSTAANILPLDASVSFL